MATQVQKKHAAYILEDCEGLGEKASALFAWKAQNHKNFKAQVLSLWKWANGFKDEWASHEKTLAKDKKKPNASITRMQSLLDGIMDTVVPRFGELLSSAKQGALVELTTATAALDDLNGGVRGGSTSCVLS